MECLDTIGSGPIKTATRLQENQIKEENISLISQFIPSERLLCLIVSLPYHLIATLKKLLTVPCNLCAVNYAFLRYRDKKDQNYFITVVNKQIINFFFYSQLPYYLFIIFAFSTATISSPFLPFQCSEKPLFPPSFFFFPPFSFVSIPFALFSFLAIFSSPPYTHISCKLLHIYNKTQTYICMSCGRILSFSPPKTYILDIV